MNEPEPTHEIVPLDEPSMEDYPDPQFLRVSRCWCVGPECQGADSLPADEFCFQEKQGVVPVRDGVRDTRRL